jgi:hypothetical protein
MSTSNEPTVDSRASRASRTVDSNRSKRLTRDGRLYGLRDRLRPADERDADCHVDARPPICDEASREFQCFGDDLVDIRFCGFHPGEAFIEATLTACDVNNPADCDTSSLATEITLVRA